MDVFSEARRRIKEVEESINEIVKQTFDKHKTLIISYNGKEQMYKLGEDSKGSLIRPKYAKSTKIKKIRLGQPIDRVTLKDTGRFHKTLKVIPYDNYVEITSDLEYSKYLLTKYGNDILGIQEELLKEFVSKYIVPKIKEETDKKLNI